MPYIRKTQDVWRLFVNYGQGWEHETTETTRAAYKVNRKQYKDNCPYPQKWERGRDKLPEKEAPVLVRSLPFKAINSRKDRS